MSLILTQWRLQDAVLDKSFLKGLPYRMLKGFLYTAYRRAKKDFPDFDTHCRVQLEKLFTLEQEKCENLDQTADSFAKILPFAAKEIEEADERRCLEELLYHIGRFIYLIDAYDDLEEDKVSGTFNPLLARFHPAQAVLAERDKTWIQTTLSHSINRVTAAYNLKQQTAWSGILDNIIYLGLPAVTKAVLDGHFVHKRGRWLRKEQKDL